MTDTPNRASGCFARISQAGSWLSLLGAVGCWLVVLVCLGLGSLALDGQFDWLAPSFSAASEADDVLMAVVLFILEFIVFGLALIAGVVVLFAGIALPAALACVLHFVGVASSFGALVASKSGGAGRLLALPALVLHLAGGASAVLWVGYWAVNLATQQG
ncbi:MAG: hypothetical protein KC502_13580 [Myxococcales bacterium]|nr:hypothetical protein [Myxococcales bacterium]